MTRHCCGVLILLLGLGCVDRSHPPSAGTPDAAITIDAGPVTCTATTLEHGAAFSSGGSANLYGAGPGAWVAHGQNGGPPGNVFYLEAYRNFFTGMTVTQTGFQNWIMECSTCTFIAEQCSAYQIAISTSGNPIQPIDCGKLYMLDTGVVAL